MEKISLYRKYRPHNFKNLVGQDHVKTTLVNALKSEHVAHAYLFAGPRGTGKTSTARLIAKSLNCENLGDGFEPCGECDLCKDIASGRLIDLIEIDAASNRGIDEMRDLKEKINFAPSRAKYKIYIIDEVHMLTKEAFNALLKTLEEPPEHAYFILATTEVHKIPDTIISRCQRFDFRRIDAAVLAERLAFIAREEGLEAESEALQLISKYADGGLRDGIGLLEQMTVEKKVTASHVQDILGMCSVSVLENLFANLMGGKTNEALSLVEELHSQGSDLVQFTHEFIDLLRQEMLKSVAAGQRREVAEMMKIIEVFQAAQQKLDASIPQLALEIAVVKVGFLKGGEVEAVVKEASKSHPGVTSGEEVVAEPVVAPAAAPSAPPVVPEVQTQEVREHQSIKEEPVVQEPETIGPELDHIDVLTLKEKWPRITERVKSPALRMSLKGAIPVNSFEKAVTLQFATNFHMAKVMEHDNRVELERVIKETLNCAVKIEAVVKELEIMPVVDEVSEPMREPPPMDAVPKTSAVSEALDIFGGEVVG